MCLFLYLSNVFWFCPENHSLASCVEENIQFPQIALRWIGSAQTGSLSWRSRNFVSLVCFSKFGSPQVHLETKYLVVQGGHDWLGSWWFGMPAYILLTDLLTSSLTWIINKLDGNLALQTRGGILAAIGVILADIFRSGHGIGSTAYQCRWSVLWVIVPLHI